MYMAPNLRGSQMWQFIRTVLFFVVLTIISLVILARGVLHTGGNAINYMANVPTDGHGHFNNYVHIFEYDTTKGTEHP
jgi:hypothetical protein